MDVDLGPGDRVVSLAPDTDVGAAGPSRSRPKNHLDANHLKP
jgi:hypothetical protein